LKHNAPSPDNVVSWELALRADGYAANTVKAYQNAVRSLAGWLAKHHPEVRPAELERRHIRGWLVEVRERHQQHRPRMVRRGPALLPLASERG
jgi:site-specific recombinase XerD